jgi:hypothetical protein
MIGLFGYKNPYFFGLGFNDYFRFGEYKIRSWLSIVKRTELELGFDRLKQMGCKHKNVKWAVSSQHC